MLIFVVIARVVNSVVNHPEFTKFGVDVDATDQANTANHAVLVAAVLLINQTHFSQVVRIKHAVIENNESVPAEHNLIFTGVPDLRWGDSISFQVSGGRIVAEILGVVGKATMPVRCILWSRSRSGCNWFG